MQNFGSIRPAKLFLQLFEKLAFSEIFVWLLHIKMNLGEKFPPDFSYGKSVYFLKNPVILNSHKKSLVGSNNLKICILA